ncbi:MAG: radical SAM protein [Eubacterium sp.]
MPKEYVYNGNIYRPTVEAGTVVVPVTEGCTHNSCRFCTMFKDIPFRMLKEDEIEYYMDFAARVYGNKVNRLFLAGADPFAMSADHLETAVRIAKKHFPSVKTITMYAAVRNVMSKSDEELSRIYDMGISDLYVGIENALDDVLVYLNKGNRIEEARTQVKRLNKAGIVWNALLMAGAAGKGRGEESARAAAEFLNDTRPGLISVTTFGVFPGTEIEQDVKNGKFIQADEIENLKEQRTLIRNLELPDTVYWAMHSLNAVQLHGVLGKSKAHMLKQLDAAITKMETSGFDQKIRLHV